MRPVTIRVAFWVALASFIFGVIVGPLLGVAELAFSRFAPASGDSALVEAGALAVLTLAYTTGGLAVWLVWRRVGRGVTNGG